MLYIAIGILGATVMPHNLYLHSSIVQTRNYERNETGKKMAIKFASIDSTVALLFAFFINAAILIVAGAAFHTTGHQGVADIMEAHKLLTPVLGATFASILFAVALLASGQNSTLTGTLAGQIVMEGFLTYKIKPMASKINNQGYCDHSCFYRYRYLRGKRNCKSFIIKPGDSFHATQLCSHSSDHIYQ